MLREKEKFGDMEGWGRCQSRQSPLATTPATGNFHKSSLGSLYMLCKEFRFGLPYSCPRLLFLSPILLTWPRWGTWTQAAHFPKTRQLKSTLYIVQLLEKLYKTEAEKDRGRGKMASLHIFTYLQSGSKQASTQRQEDTEAKPFLPGFGNIKKCPFCFACFSA